MVQVMGEVVEAKCGDRGLVTGRLLGNIGHPVLNGRYEAAHDPPYTFMRGQEATIIEYATIAGHHLRYVSWCTILL